MLPRRSFLFGAALLAGCRPARPPARPVPERWTSTLGLDHPLVGKIVRVDRGAFVGEDELVATVGASPCVLLGEQHDNVDHHRLQARIVAAIGAGRAIVLEMVDRDHQAALDASALDLDALPGALDWAKSGWPPFPTYRPIFEAANAARAKLVAGNLPRADAKAIAKGGAASSASSPWVAQAAPLPEAARASLAEELRASHCGHLPEAMVVGMAAAQTARDACLADAMLTAERSILIAGAGHTRRDRGVPFQLAARGSASVAIAFVEVAPGKNAPAEYADRWGAPALPFDFAWFTPRATDDDPCKAFGGRK